MPVGLAIVIYGRFPCLIRASPGAHRLKNAPSLSEKAP